MPDKAKAAEAKARGNTAFSAKNFEVAIKEFTEAISHDDTDHVFFSNRSACYASVEKYEEALADANKCVSIKPEWGKGYSRKGLAEFNMGKIDEAEASYQKGLELLPNDAALQDGLKNVQASKMAGGQDPVKSAIMMAVQTSPQIQEYLKDEKFQQTLMAILQAPPGQTQSLLMAAMQQDPRFSELLMASMGGGAGGAGSPFGAREPPKPKEATVDAPFRRKPVEKPKEEDKRTESQKKADGFKDEGNALYKKRLFSEALGEYDQAITAEPNDATYYANKAAVYIEMKEHDKCIALCQEVLDKRYDMNGALEGGASFEKIAKIYTRMANSYKAEKKFDLAIDMCNKALTEDNNKVTRNTLRDMQRMKEKYEADAYLNPELAEKHREAGNAHFKAQQYAEAKKEYDEAIMRNPKDAKLYSNRAAALTKLAASPDALKDLDKCLELDPTFVKAYSRKGAAHFFMKEYHKAIKAYENGLKLDPTNEECKRGKEQTIAKISATQGGPQDEEQIRHAMADPEIQEILKDPQMNIILGEMQKDPARINEYMQDPTIASAINKLIGAGIMKVGSAPPGGK